MKTIYSLILIILSFSCNSQTNARQDNSTKKQIENLAPDFDVALKFINDYTEYCNNLTRSNIDSNWIHNNRLITEKFKTTYKNLLDSAYKIEPEVGLDFDPIFDGNDFPDKGFTILTTDNNSGFVTVKGKDWEEFKVTLKVVYQNEKWLVDGSGIINIPKVRQARR